MSITLNADQLNALRRGRDIAVVESARPARVIPIHGRHRRSLHISEGRVTTGNTLADHTGEHDCHGFGIDKAACPACYPASYSDHTAKHRAEGTAR